MGYYEADPLLPKDKPSPEIQGSRPQSITYQDDCEANADEAEDALEASSFDGRSVLGFLVALFTTTLLASAVFPELLKSVLDGLPFHPPTVHQRVNRILSETPLIDGHNDLAILVRFLFNNHIYDDKFRIPFTEGGMKAHVDLPRLKEGKVGGAFWAAFVPCPPPGTDFSDETYTEAVAFTYSQIDLLTRLQVEYPQHFSLPGNSSTALSAFKAGQLISPIAIEGLHQIGNSLSNLRSYYNLGVRYATLTHNCHNKYADAALQEISGGGITKAKPVWNGVSPAGEELIHEMNRLGMMVDLSHVSQDTMRDVLGGKGSSWSGSIAPPMFSHSSAFAICPHPRNVPDDVLQLVKQRNSIVMVNFSPDFVSCTASTKDSGLPDFYPANSTIKHVVTHIKYIGDLIGYNHVGLGSDFDGIPSTPEGLDDVSKFPDLVAEMLNVGISDEDASKVVGGNILRVWTEVDRVAKSLQEKGKPAEDDLPGLFSGHELLASALGLNV